MSARQILFGQVETGQSITSLQLGPLTTSHLVRWCGASENWHKIHYDAAFAVQHDGLPGLLINGSLKQHFLAKMLKDWAGGQGRLWKLSYQFRAMNLVGEALTAWGIVTGTEERGRFGLVYLAVGIRNEHGRESTPGKAAVVLPLSTAVPVPYPFDPERDLA
ncbi:MAG: hypothetical protein LBE86_07705 [Gemmobacter sp.]|jgi:acyl dehydratase|nr:hypothetical protein [Gemmobacter sp.]